MNFRVLVVSGVLAAPLMAFAQQVPAVDSNDPSAASSTPTTAFDRSPAPATAPSSVAPTTKRMHAPPTPPQVNLLTGHDASLSGTEKQSVGIARDWINGADSASRGPDGAVVYTYGGTLPSVVCAPLHVCAIALQPGEQVTKDGVHAGDTTRWEITPAMSGAGDAKVATLMIKPSDIGLVTDLIVATDRRLYEIKLVSRKDDWMPLVRFAYPEDAQASWAAFQKVQEKEHRDTVLPTGENIAALDFTYDISSDDDVEWKPLRVYTNGSKTYLQFPSSVAHGDLPALVALGSDDKEVLVNYRTVGDRFEVDKLLRHAALIRGVGSDQKRVEITYKGKL